MGQYVVIDMFNAMVILARLSLEIKKKLTEFS